MIQEVSSSEIWFFIIGILLTVIFGVVFYGFWRKLGREETHKNIQESTPEENIRDDFTASQTLKQALQNTEKSLFGRIRATFVSENGRKNIDQIEEVLFTSDIGPTTVNRLMGLVDEELSRSEKADIESIKAVLRREFSRIFSQTHIGDMSLAENPSVIMVVGVNGAGKTTSIGKLSAQLAKSGKKVLVAAGDTFRAAAGNQLKVWTDRAQVDIYSPENISDPSAVAFEAIQRAKANAYDVVIVDTAGRLHTQVNLMEELKKMKRVITKAIPTAPHEVLIVLDANSGQNALMQAREFNNALQLTGVVLTKMDGTAKGGVAIGLVDELRVPIRFIGIGEKIGDLQPFSPTEFIDSIL